METHFRKYLLSVCIRVNPWLELLFSGSRMQPFNLLKITPRSLPFVLLALILVLVPNRAAAQQQFQGVCSRVKMVIEQELTLERIGFEALLEVTNNDGEDPLTDFSASITFENADTTNAASADASSLFFVRAPTLESINAIDGTGVIGPTKKAVVKWFIIPKIAAGGTNAFGVRYRVNCNLAAKIRGAAVPQEVMFAIPDTITVKPEPQLNITYFQPRDVQGDDPFTPEVESPIPFTLGVLVKNEGYGPARNLKIDSQQPRITENLNGLLLIARLLGARVMDSPLRTTSLLVDLGDINPARTRKGAWDMITSLSGEFVEFKASYKHASELGGEETSVIKSLEAHFIAKEVLNDQPGRDAIKDFLADVDRDSNLIPETLYESDGNLYPVNYLTNATTVGSAGPGGSFQVQLQADVAGLGYMRLTDPGQARLKIASVVRNDGKVLNTNNAWTNIRYTRIGNIRQNFLNIFDLVSVGNYTYTVTYAAGGLDTIPPVTTMYFAGAVTEAGGKHYITPDTQIYFISEDQNPVSIVYSLTNSAFLPAIPFSLTAPGEYQVRFYATDTGGNIEATKTNILVVSGEAALDFASVELPTDPIFIAGGAVSIRPGNAPLVFQASTNPATVNAAVDVFQGVRGFATIAGAPSSPTVSNRATLTIGGENVDYYKFKLDGLPWSADQPLSAPLSLSNLTQGAHTVLVLGRSQYGAYAADSNAVSASWTVSSTAPATLITGTPASPSRLRNATLLVAGSGVTDYRWTINSGFYRPETTVATPIILTNLSAGPQIVSVNGRIGGNLQGVSNATSVQWVYDPLYGHTLTGLARVRSLTYSNIGSSVQTFAWDGKNDAGVIVAPGWYTVRVTLADSLGRTNFATRLVRIEDLSGGATEVAGVIRGPKNPYARRNTAVWSDQSDGTAQIYAQNVIFSNSPIVKLTSGILAQENARTDGRFVAWQARQTNGNWDIMLKELDGTNDAVAVTSTLLRDEINPSVEWPWVVFQSRSTVSPGAPWQVRAVNMLTAFSELVSISTQDQLNPDVQDGRVVWQDWRDVGPGEIYLKNLDTAEVRRMTTNTFGQYHPAISGNWIVWQDNRNGQDDLYAFDMLRNRELRLTATPENETRAYIDGPWVVCEEDSLGPLTANARLVHLPSVTVIPLTRTPTGKARPTLASGRLVWSETENNLARVLSASLPSLQAVFNNQNAVAVTDAMVTYQQNAHNLLATWNAQAGVQELTLFSSLVPNVVAQTVTWNGTGATGPNFSLTAGTFLWIKFGNERVLDLGVNAAGALNLTPGVNVFSHIGFPSQYSAYQLLRQLGLSNARAVRALDAETGNWKVAVVNNGQLVGNDFPIAKVAVLMVDMANPVNSFIPQ
jgi:beta propeller repeat protein